MTAPKQTPEADKTEDDNMHIAYMLGFEKGKEAQQNSPGNAYEGITSPSLEGDEPVRKGVLPEQCRVDALEVLKRETYKHFFRCSDEESLKNHEEIDGDYMHVIDEIIDYLASRNLLAGGALEAKYKSLVAQMDKLLGTPCEQIRHQQEMETARYYISELRMFLEASITKGVGETEAYSIIGAAGTFLERTLPSPPASTGERGE